MEPNRIKIGVPETWGQKEKIAELSHRMFPLGEERTNLMEENNILRKNVTISILILINILHIKYKTRVILTFKKKARREEKNQTGFTLSPATSNLRKIAKSLNFKGKEKVTQQCHNSQVGYSSTKAIGRYTLK
jgi:hypothetical protein